MITSCQNCISKMYTSSLHLSGSNHAWIPRKENHCTMPKPWAHRVRWGRSENTHAHNEMTGLLEKHVLAWQQSIKQSVKISSVVIYNTAQHLFQLVTRSRNYRKNWRVNKYLLDKQSICIEDTIIDHGNSAETYDLYQQTWSSWKSLFFQ